MSGRFNVTILMLIVIANLHFLLEILSITSAEMEILLFNNTINFYRKHIADIFFNPITKEITDRAEHRYYFWGASNDWLGFFSTTHFAFTHSRTLLEMQTSDSPDELGLCQTPTRPSNSHNIKMGNKSNYHAHISDTVLCLVLHKSVVAAWTHLSWRRVIRMRILPLYLKAREREKAE